MEGHTKTNEETLLWETLLGAGFFRARLADPLPPFDKLLFGLAWGITNASVDVELELTLDADADATLGQKLRLCEAVERALRAMRCPAPLQAHQIQGLDFPAIFPVVQWLVKRVLAAREEFGDARRSFALARYGWRGYAPLDASAASKPLRVAGRAAALDAQFPVTRRLRRTAGVAAPSRAAALRWTLLEYGGSTAAAAAEPASSSAAAGAEAELAEASADVALSRAAAARLVGLRASELSALAARAPRAAAPPSREAVLSRQLEAAQRALAAEQAREAEALSRAAEAAALAEERAEQLAALLAHNARCADEAAQLDAGALGSGRPAALLKGLRELRALKEEESAFKARCREQLATLQGEVEAAESGQPLLPPDEAARLCAVAEAHAAGETRLAAARAALSQRSLAVALLRRRLDELPGRPELAQYEARFVELARTVGEKLAETRRWFAAHNAAAEALRVLQAELNLLNRLRTQYDVVRGADDDARASFVASLAAAQQGVADNLRRQQEKCARELAALAEAQDQHAAALQQGRAYFAALKCLEDEFQRAASLQAALEAKAAAH
jgi:hypothetical protein